MTGSLIRRAPIVAALAAVASLSLAAAAPAAGPAPNQRHAKFEQRFLTMTIDHHFAGVKMGEICVEKNTDSRLDEACADIIEAQSQEIEEMRGYLRDWYGEDKEPMLDAQALSDLEELREAEPGKEFDVLISEMFIEHHLMQIERSESCLKKASHDELKDLCERQIEMQSEEIEVFEAVIEGYEGDHGDDHAHGHDGKGDHGKRRHGGHDSGHAYSAS